MEDAATSREIAREAALVPDPEIAEENLPDLAQAPTQEAHPVVAEDITEGATLPSVTETEAMGVTEAGLPKAARPAVAVAIADPDQDQAATAEDLNLGLLATID